MKIIYWFIATFCIFLLLLSIGSVFDLITDKEVSGPVVFFIPTATGVVLVSLLAVIFTALKHILFKNTAR